MNYYIYENTRYDKEAQKSIPYSWTLTWSVRTNSPSRTQAKIAGQDRKVFTDKAAMEKYQRIRVETASTPGRIHRRLSIRSSNRRQLSPKIPGRKRSVNT